VVVLLLGNIEHASAVSYLAIFFGTIVIIFIIASLLRKLLKLVLLGWADSLGGGMLGSFKGGLLCAVILIVLTSFLRPGTPLLAQSRVAPYIKEFSVAVVSFFPPEIRREFTRKSRSLDTLWKQEWIRNFNKDKENTRESK
jgi:membrane protein required for colicin V production